MKSTRDSTPLTRRDALKATLAAGGAWAALGLLPETARAQEGGSLKKGSTILFQGDSITDAGRNRRAAGPNDSGGLGRGYPFLLSGYLLATRPELDFRCYNRGISGNKVPDLEKRWKKDTIDLAPDLVSILVGVNDLWHKLGGHYNGTVEDYEKGFAALLERTSRELPRARLVVCEPYVLRCGAVNDRWFPELDQRRAAARRVAEKAKATWIGFQSMFDEASTRAAPTYWSRDGVHPTLAGHALMAGTWLRAVRL